MFRLGLVPRDTDQLEARSGQEDAFTISFVNYDGELTTDVGRLTGGTFIRIIENVIAALDGMTQEALMSSCRLIEQNPIEG